jgi:hypothetical protein
MPIRSFIGDTAFDPETLETMNTALLGTAERNGTLIPHDGCDGIFRCMIPENYEPKHGASTALRKRARAATRVFFMCSTRSSASKKPTRWSIAVRTPS